jgi:hypothetical protein
MHARQDHAWDHKWQLGTYMIEPDGWEDALSSCAWCGRSRHRPNYVIVGDVVPLVSKETGEIECVVPHYPGVWERLDAMTPVSG